MKYITDEQLEEFFSTLNGKYFRDDFYNLFMNFLDNKGIKFEDDEDELYRDELEEHVFNLAKERGFIGYDIIETIYDLNAFQEKLNKLIKKNGYSLFHFFYDIDNDISTTSFWSKWNQLPPLGWVANWCTCGHFYPCTFDMSEMNLDEGVFTPISEEYRPREIDINHISMVLLCDDGFFRLILEDGKTIAVRPYKFDTGFAYNFVTNPLDILK